MNNYCEDCKHYNTCDDAKDNSLQWELDSCGCEYKKLMDEINKEKDSLTTKPGSEDK